MKFKIEYDIVKYLLWVKYFFAKGRPRGVWPASVNLGPRNISESRRGRKLKLKSQLDILKYSR